MKTWKLLLMVVLVAGVVAFVALGPVVPENVRLNQPYCCPQTYVPVHKQSYVSVSYYLWGFGGIYDPQNGMYYFLWSPLT